MVPTGNENMEVNVIECTKVSNNGQVQIRYEEDAVENTSSFGDTLSDNENASISGEMEVESHFLFADAPQVPPLIRRKSLTDHWRRSIRPLKWRCKWLELQIKNLQCQSMKYDRELEKHAERQLFDFYLFEAREFDAKSLPFYSSGQRKKAMQRKKRKRIEEMTDIMPYMLQHNVFSYYENRKSAVNFGSFKDDCSNVDKATNATDEFELDDDEWPSFESKDDDNIREKFLRKIEVLQSQVRKLKARIEKVASDNPGKFSSGNMLSTPAHSDVFTYSDQNPSSVSEYRDQMPFRFVYTTPQHTADMCIGNLLPESAVSSHGEITLHDMIQNTAQPQVKVSGENTGEGILIDNQWAKEVMKDNKLWSRFEDKR